VENVGLENAAPDCRGGKHGTGKLGTRLQGWKTRDWKMQESEKYGKRRFQKCVSDCTD